MSMATSRPWQPLAERALRPPSAPAGQGPKSQRDLDGPGYDRENDHVMGLLACLGLPLNRDNYLSLLYPDGLPQSWSTANEPTLPPEIRV